MQHSFITDCFHAFRPNLAIVHTVHMTLVDCGCPLPYCKFVNFSWNCGHVGMSSIRRKRNVKLNLPNRCIYCAPIPNRNEYDKPAVLPQARLNLILTIEASTWCVMYVDVLNQKVDVKVCLLELGCPLLVLCGGSLWAPIPSINWLVLCICHRQRMLRAVCEWSPSISNLLSADA